MIDYIRSQIKKRRVEKQLTQSDIALDLGITPGAYSKIESGPTEISVKKLVEIAAILEVDITYFFENKRADRVDETSRLHGLATKEDIEQLARSINKINQELAVLKAGLPGVAFKKRK